MRPRGAVPACAWVCPCWSAGKSPGTRQLRRWQDFLLKLGAKPGAGSGPFTPKPPFWDKPGFLIYTASAADPEAEEQRFVSAAPDVYAGIKKQLDQSRRTVTRTDYEVDFAEVRGAVPCAVCFLRGPSLIMGPLPAALIRVPCTPRCGQVYNKLTSLGAKFDKNAYLYRVPIQAIA